MTKFKISPHEYEVFGDLVLAAEYENVPFDGDLYLWSEAPSPRSRTVWEASGRGRRFEIHLYGDEWGLVEL